MLSSAPRATSRSSLITGRPPERFEPTTVAGSPSTCSVAPLAKRSSSSLARSTKNEPSSPCGFPTRPIRTSSATGRDEDRGGAALEDLRRLFARRGSHDSLVQDLRGSGPLAPAISLDDAPVVDRCLALLRLAVDEERPERCDLAFVRQTDAARVDEADSPDDAVLLHVRVAGHDHALLDSSQDLGEALVGSRGRDHLVVAPRRRVAVEDAVAHGRRCLPLQEGDLLLREAGALPVVGVAVGVAADERGLLDRANELQCLPRLRAPGEITAEDHLVDALALELGQDSLERGPVPVHVVQGRDPHQRSPRAAAICSKRVITSSRATAARMFCSTNDCAPGQPLASTASAERSTSNGVRRGSTSGPSTAQNAATSPS